MSGPIAPRRGRPPRTSARDLELVALRLFSEQGYDETTVDQIAAAAGVTDRTFFRYFDTKADVLWHAFDDEVRALKIALSNTSADMNVHGAIREAVISVNHYTPADLPELRTRINLISTVPALQASAATHYDAWERAVIDFSARRLGTSPNSLVPLALGRATLAVCRSAYDCWVARGDADLTAYLGQALDALAVGFADTNHGAAKRLTKLVRR